MQDELIKAVNTLQGGVNLLSQEVRSNSDSLDEIVKILKGEGQNDGLIARTNNLERLNKKIWTAIVGVVTSTGLLIADLVKSWVGKWH